MQLSWKIFFFAKAEHLIKPLQKCPPGPTHVEKETQQPQNYSYLVLAFLLLFCVFALKIEGVFFDVFVDGSGGPVAITKSLPGNLFEANKLKLISNKT